MKKFKLDLLVRKNIKDMTPYSSARDEFIKSGEQMIFLDANENPYGSGLNRYPDSKQDKIKAKLSELKKLPSDQIFLGNGSDEVLDLILRAFCEPNRDKIISLSPTYGMYEVLANINAVKIKKIELDKNFQPNVDLILEADATTSKLLFLCSPNNPTGNSFEPEIVERLLRNFKGLVVIDEAYIDFSIQESWIERLNEFENLLIVQTFSKAYGLAGIRLGVCYASPNIIAILNKIKPPYNINTLSETMALEKLGKTTELFDQIETIIEQRKLIEKALTKISFVKKIYPSDANFILIKVDDASIRYKQLLERGLVSRNRSSLPLCHNTLRITVGTEKESKNLIETLKDLAK